MTSVFRPFGGSKGRLVSVLVEFITRAAKKEQAVPHNMARDTATFTEGPRNRSEDPGKHDDVLYPLKPLVVCMLAPGKDVTFRRSKLISSVCFYFMCSKKLYFSL